MYHIFYEIKKEDDSTEVIEKTRVKQPNFNENVLSFIEVDTGQFIIYDFNNKNLCVKEIKKISIEKLED